MMAPPLRSTMADKSLAPQQSQPPQNAAVDVDVPALARSGGGIGNAARQDTLRANGSLPDPGASPTKPVVDEFLLEGIIAQVVRAAPEELAEFAATHIPIILKQAAYEGITDPNQVAYLLATAEHESKFGKPKYQRSEPLVEDHNPYTERDRTIRPRRKGEKPRTVHEWAATDHVEGKHVSAGTRDELDTEYWDAAYGGKLGNRKGTDDASRYRGRGYVQLTGKVNYEDRSQALNAGGNFYMKDGKLQGGERRPIDLAKNPEDVNQVPDLAAQVLVTGARDGSFTRKKLDDYIKPGEDPDFVNARRVINGDTSKNGASIAQIARRYASPLASTWKKAFNSGRQTGPR